MIRTLLEYLLNRSMDDGKSPGGWLVRQLRRDSKLQRFDTDARRLDTLLRESAAEHRKAMAITGEVDVLTLSPERPLATAAPTRRSNQSALWVAGLAVAAMLLLMASPQWFRPAAPTVHAGEFAQQLTVAPGEVLRLINHAAETSQTQLPQLSPLNKLALTQLPAWQDVATQVESPVRNELDAWQRSWQNLKSRWPESPRKL